MARDASTLRGSHRLRADVVVVGAGAGGAACAHELASRGMKVVVLEEGHRYAPKSFPASTGWALNHIYAEKGLRMVEADTTYPMPGGRGVGGSTLINSAICFRAPDPVLSHWADAGLEALAPEKLAPIYTFVEEIIGVVQMHPLQARANNLFIKRGAEKLGLDGAFIHRNAPGCVGCGVCQLGCPTGGKGSVDRNFIPAAEELGTEVCADCKVAKIRLENGRARGVTAVVRDSETDEQVGLLEVEAEAVVLSAGAVGTPRILIEQGLSKRSPQVGKNLSIHPATGTWGFVPEAINSWDGVPQAYAVFLDRKRGILLQTYNANPELFFANGPWSGLDGMRKLRRMKNLAMCGAIVSDRPSGEISIGPTGRPRIRYQLQDEERQKLVESLRAVVRILFAAGATEVYPGVGGTAQTVTNEADALSRLPDSLPEKQMQVYASHPMGTCRMGVDPRSSVVGPTGEMHGVPGLYVADASLMPSSLGVNPQLTVMAMGIVVGRALSLS